MEPCSQRSEALVPLTRERRTEREGGRLGEDGGSIHPPLVVAEAIEAGLGAVSK